MELHENPKPMRFEHLTSLDLTGSENRLGVWDKSVQGNLIIFELKYDKIVISNLQRNHY